MFYVMKRLLSLRQLTTDWFTPVTFSYECVLRYVYEKKNRISHKSMLRLDMDSGSCKQTGSMYTHITPVRTV